MTTTAHRPSVHVSVHCSDRNVRPLPSRHLLRNTNNCEFELRTRSEPYDPHSLPLRPPTQSLYPQFSSQQYPEYKHVKPTRHTHLGEETMNLQGTKRRTPLRSHPHSPKIDSKSAVRSTLASSHHLQHAFKRQNGKAPSPTHTLPRRDTACTMHSLGSTPMSRSMSPWRTQQTPLRKTPRPGLPNTPFPSKCS